MGWLAIAKIIALVVYPVIEYFLGKTSQGSVLGVVLNVIVSILKALGIVPSEGVKK